jgi:hypothetical protein
LSLELGLSIWLYESQIEVEEAFGAMAEVRSLIIEEAGLDGRTEPVPLVGRGVESDLVVMASYLDGLLGRAASVCGCSLEALADRVIARQGSDAVVVRGRSVGSVTSGLFRTARG